MELEFQLRDPVLTSRFYRPGVIFGNRTPGTTKQSAGETEAVLVTGHESGKIRFWTIPNSPDQTVKLTWDWKVAASGITAIEIHPLTSRLIAADRDGNLRLLNLAAQPFEVLKLREERPTSPGSRSPFVRVHFDDQRNRILAIDLSGNLLQWPYGTEN